MNQPLKKILSDQDYLEIISVSGIRVNAQNTLSGYNRLGTFRCLVEDLRRKIIEALMLEGVHIPFPNLH